MFTPYSGSKCYAVHYITNRDKGLTFTSAYKSDIIIQGYSIKQDAEDNAVRIALCDDEKQTSEKLYDMIENISRSLDVITDVFTDGNELLRRFAQKSYDLVFLDIEMPAIDGLTVAEKLRDMSAEVFIVFLTSHVEYAIKGYEVNALRYLTKPPVKEKVREVIEHVRKKQAEEKTLWVKTGDGEYKLKLSDIIYIEALNQKMLIHKMNSADMISQI